MEEHTQHMPFSQPWMTEMSPDRILEKNQALPKAPSLYEVLLLNDEFTTMEFVVLVLKEIFHKNEAQATAIMMQTHHYGEGQCGIYTRDIAETKMIQVIDMARQHNFPLKCIMVKH